MEQYTYNNQTYNIIIQKKNNKNTYIKVNDNLDIIVTTNYFVFTKDILSLINKNTKYINKMIDHKTLHLSKDKSFYLFGKPYSIIYNNKLKETIIQNNAIITPNDKKLEKFLNNLIEETFFSHLKQNYSLFKENISYQKIKIRKMKTRWGVCNYVQKTITLNYYLYKYDIICLDYVIIHELSHLVYHDHSPSFWQLVHKYCPNYKQIKKMLKE